MRRAILLFVLLSGVVAGGTLAQRDCGDGLPCGRLIWDLPVLPTLASPTPMPTIQITAILTSTPVPTGAPTATAVPTGTIMADFSDIGEQMQTLAAVVAATDMPMFNASGTPMSSSEQLTEFTTNAGTFFSYLQGLQEVTLGGWSALIGLVVSGLLITFVIKGTGFIIPVVAVLFRLILRIVEVVKKLIGL